MARERPEDWAAWMAPGTSARGSLPDEEPSPSAQPALDTAPAPEPAAEPASDLEPAPDSATEPGSDSQPAPDSATESDEVVAGVRSARREATRQRVLDAAREVFAERGVIGGTVEDICERAGYTRGAFYSNFTDKDDVLEALVAREHARLLEQLDASLALVDQELAAAPDLGTAIASIVDRILGSVPVDRQLSLVQTELEIHAIRRPDLARPFLDATSRFHTRIAVFLEAAMARNGLELMVDPEDVVDASVAVVERSVRRALLAGGQADPDAMARAVLPAMLLSLSRSVAR